LIQQPQEEPSAPPSISYHFIVLNGMITPHMSQRHQRWGFLDGAVECGRLLDKTLSYKSSPASEPEDGKVAICLIGDPGKFTVRQLYAAREVINALRWEFDLPAAKVVGHSELEPGISCPGLDMQLFRRFLNDDRYLEELLEPQPGRGKEVLA